MDINKAKEIHSSMNWAEICKELDSWIAVEFQKLRTCIPDQLGVIQIEIKVLEKVKNLPQIIIEREE